MAIWSFGQSVLLRKPRADKRPPGKMTTRGSDRNAKLGIESLEPRRVLDSTVVFNEVMYNPLGDDAVFEWIELYNQMSVDMDLSGWLLADAVQYTFPADTILGGGQYLVVAKAPDALRDSGAVPNPLGPLAGQLDNAGERIELRNHTGRLMDVLEYRDDGDWPAGPDGSGASLAKRHPQSATEPAENWTFSRQMGGTPGRANFPPDALPETLLELSEVAAAADRPFWIELHNRSNEDVSLNGYVLAGSRSDAGRYVLPDVTIAAGGFHVVSASELGFVPRDGERIFLYTPDQSQLVDAVRVTERLQGRSPDHDDRWQFPQTATPGAPNAFAFHDEIVINEIMYHARPTFATSAVVTSRPVMEIDATWRYDESGADLGTAWRNPGFDDRAWKTGTGLFFVETAPLPAPKNTPLTHGKTTYYFRTTFDWNEPVQDAQLVLRHVVDDGAVFYLNGVEWLRYNLPDGPISFDTDAIVAVGNASHVGPVEVPDELLVPGANVLAVEVHQRFASSPDVVFGAELSLLRQTVPATPFAESSEEWIELYNRSGQTVDLSGWRLDDAVGFEFPAGTALGPDQYLVVAHDAAAFAAKHPDVRITGEFSGQLSDKHERIQLLDRQGNLADEVHYYDSGRWPQFADAGGSSLELRDPNADNSKGEAWAASNEAARSEWTHVSYTRTIDPIVHDPPISFHEFVMGLLTAGEVLVDNVSVLEDPAGTNRELIQNGTFDADAIGGQASKWRIVGTHRQSEVIQDPDRSDNRVLRLVAEAPMNYLSNHAETTLADGARVVNGQTYQISFDAKWITGSPQLHTELYYKDAARTTILPQPEISGTPGQRNSTWQPNLGPTYDGLRHEPPVPKSTDEVVVRVNAADADGISSMQLLYAVGGVAPFTSVPMTQDAQGRYTATIPAQPNRTVVQFYVQGEDRRGAITTFPAAGQDSRALYKVDDRFTLDTVRHDFRIIMIPAETRELQDRLNMVDNNRWGSTVIYDGQEIFYNVGTRLKGSMFSRQNISTTGYNVRFYADQPFRGIHENVRFDQNGEDEILVKYFTAAIGNPGGTYDDVFQLTTPSGSGGGPTLTFLAAHDDVFLREQFDRGEEGMMFEFEGIRVMQTTVDRNPESPKLYQPIGWVPQFDIQDLGNDKELYRWPFLVSRNRYEDDYRRMIDLAKAFSATGSALERAVADVVDVDQWMSTFAIMSLFGIGDVYSQGNPHNLHFYVRPSDNKMLVFPWDWDFVFNQSASAPLHGGQNISRVIEIPTYEHLFLGHLHHMIQTKFNRQQMERWTTHFGTVLRASLRGHLTRIDQRASFVLRRLPPEVPFDITSQPAEVDQPAITLEGSGWINVRQIRLAGDSRPLAVRWSDTTAWQATVPLQPGRNELVLEAVDFAGQVVGTDTITVTSTIDRPLLDLLRISEIMYHPADPNTAERAAGFANDDDFEFVEILNTSQTESLNLEGVRVTGGIEFLFPAMTLEAGQRTVLVSNRLAFQHRYGSQIDVAGQYAGRLSNGGDDLMLLEPAGATIVHVRYSDGDPWPMVADGSGASLDLVDPAGTPADQMSSPTRWRAAQPTPGGASFSAGDFNADGTVDIRDVNLLCGGIRAGQIQFDLDGDGLASRADLTYLIETVLRTHPGDADLNGVFDSGDLVQVFRAGQYEDGVSNNSTWAEGDWNCDGEFDTGDLVVAFRGGGYTARAVPALPLETVAAVIGEDRPVTQRGAERRDVAYRLDPAPNRSALPIDIAARDLIFERLARAVARRPISAPKFAARNEANFDGPVNKLEFKSSRSTLSPSLPDLQVD